MKSILLAFLIFTYINPTVAQEEEKIKLPDNVMEQVVKRVAVWYFKPSRLPRTIYFADRLIRAEWLPKIKNVTFVVLDNEEVMDRDKGVHFFKQIDYEKGIYIVWYGFGEPICSGAGDLWNVRLRENRVLIWRDKDSHWGSVCGTSSDAKRTGRGSNHFQSFHVQSQF